MKLYGTLSPRASHRRHPGRGFTHGARASAGGFSMARQDRLFGDWQTTNITNDALLASQLVPMRNRSRQLARDEDYMKALLIAVRNNVIGPKGVVLQMDIKDAPKPVPRAGAWLDELVDHVATDTRQTRDLVRSVIAGAMTRAADVDWVAEPDALANDVIEKAYAQFSQRWTLDPAGARVPGFTTSGRFSRTEFAHLGITTTCRDGEFFWRVVRGFNNPSGLSYQPINPDYVDELKNEVLHNGDEIRMGVQRNPWGQVTGFWLRTWNPGDTFWTGRGAGSYKSEFVPAADIRHFYVPDDFDLSRGYPWIHAGATRLKMLGGWEEATLEAARAGACAHDYLEQSDDPNAPAAEYSGDAVDADGNRIDNIEPGMVRLLPKGLKAKSIDPSYPTTEHSNFITATMGGVCAGLGLSRLTMTGDLTQANYSSMRAGLLPEREQWKVIQSLWIWGVELPNFYDWLRMRLLKGIKLPNGSILPAHSFEKFAQPCFLGRRWPWVDPAKDQDANATALAQRVTSRFQIVGEMGDDLDETFRDIAQVQKMAKQYGITLPEDVEATCALMLAKKPDTGDDGATPPPKPKPKAP